MKLTVAEGRVLALLCSGKYHLYGAEVRTARRLEQRGLCVVEDFGDVRRSGMVDGERWGVTITDAGRQLVTCPMCGSTAGSGPGDDGLERCLNCGCH
ncbi:MAG: hypothetical protein AMXMBFR56_65770 [Polyangiaceae bacterium]